MLNSLICGTSNLPEEQDIEELLSPCSKSTPKKNKKISKNPYANRGLDKFNALLDELESKKQKIYIQKGSQDISFVRFVYSSSNDWKPIVVKAKERKLKFQVQNEVMKKNISNISATTYSEEKEKVVEESTTTATGEFMKQRNKKSRWVFKIGDLIQPTWYIPVMIVMVLLFLIIYGKTFAILCSSIGWYLVPKIKDSYSTSNSTSTSNSKSTSTSTSTSTLNSKSNSVMRWNSSLDKPKRKKDYGRRLSEKIVGTKDISSPKSVLSGPVDSQFSHHAHRKSWS